MPLKYPEGCGNAPRVAPTTGSATKAMTLSGPMRRTSASIPSMLCFEAATQGYFVAKSRWYETVGLLLVAFMLFRPGFFLDQVTDKYVAAEGPAALTLMADTPEGQDIRLTIEGPDFDTGEVRPVTVVLPSAGAATLDAQGLLVIEEGDKLLLDEPFGLTEALSPISGQEFDYYGDTPVTIAKVEVENERIAKEVFFIPALILLLLIMAIQRPRATQPAF